VKSKYPLLVPWLVLVPVIFMGSCMPEKEIAKKFIETRAGIHLQVFTPQFLYKYNHKGEEIPGFDSLTETQQDSALYTDSRYIRYIEDSIYLDKYVNNFIDELRELGFKVFLDTSLEAFLAGQPQSYLVNIAQIQLDEYIYPYEEQEVFFDTVFYKLVDVNAVDASVWFELNKLNAQNPVKRVLYSSFTTTDGLDGRFYSDPLTWNVQYRYTLDTLRIEDIYDLAAYTGRKHASFLFDYFMNQYIAYHMPEGMDVLGYFHYNRFRNTVTLTEDEMFEVLDSR
jgi:hypothetical protein